MRAVETFLVAKARAFNGAASRKCEKDKKHSASKEVGEIRRWARGVSKVDRLDFGGVTREATVLHSKGGENLY